jgi:predicted DsbA family dithiol-disulfide isomerase
MEQAKIKIEVWSDFICPFCYLGKRKLYQALDRLGLGNKAEIIWHSYQLDPDFPRNKSISSLQYLIEKKHYQPGQIEGIHQYLTEQGRLYDIDFRFDKALTFNTYDAHRLWQWSKNSGKSNEFKEAVFLAYFTKGIDLSGNENLLNIITDLGLDRSEADRILNSDSFDQEIEMDKYQSRQLGIRGVPYFLINDKKDISGAQDDRVFDSVLSSSFRMAQLYSQLN